MQQIKTAKEGDTIELLRRYAGCYTAGTRYVLGPMDAHGHFVARAGDCSVYFDPAGEGESYKVVEPAKEPHRYPRVGDKVRLIPSGGAFDSHAPVYAKIVDKDMLCGEVVYTVVPTFGDGTRTRRLVRESFEIVTE